MHHFSSGDPDRQLAVTFRTAATGLAGDLLDACRPLLPAPQARILRVDELSVTQGLERTTPLAAAAMALGPAVAAAGVSVCALSRTGPAAARGTVEIAASVLEAASDVLDVLEGGRNGAEATLHLAHRVARATHLSCALADGGAGPAGEGAGLRAVGPPALWSRLADALSARISASRGGGGIAAARTGPEPVRAAAACRDAARHCMRAHARGVATRAASSTERLLRCLTFASLYCGFAALDQNGSRSEDPAGGFDPPRREIPDARLAGHRWGQVPGPAAALP